MPLSLQPPLVRSDARRCVLATVEDARRQLRDWDVDEDDILALIEDGQLFAWNIAVDLKDAKRLWRIFPDSISHFEKTAGHRQFIMTDAAIYKRLLEGCGDLLTIRELANLFNCGPTHVANLIAAKNFSDCNNGPGVTRVERAALLAFLKSRMEGAL